MNIVGVDFESIADGVGVRVVVFVAGCKHNCAGCHNPDSHSFTAGKPFTEDIQKEIIEYVRQTPYISGITMSGGDPVFSIDDTISFLDMVADELPDIDVWLYTGFTFEELYGEIDRGRKLLSLVDVLVDGKFDITKRSVNLPYRGSSNQRIIDVYESCKAEKAILVKEFEG